MDLIGRSQQVQYLLDLMKNPEIRLVNLTGPAGVGKTRLANEVIHHLADQTSTQTVSFATVSESGFLPAKIGESLGIAPVGAESWEARVVDHLRDKKLVLFLDNLEHLLPVPFLSRMIVACPQLQLLTTSRVVLYLSDEHLVQVHPLEVPPANSELTPGELEKIDSVKLLVARARRVNPAFAVTDDNAADIATLVRALDGLPLAIELAAARLNTLSPEAMCARLNDRLSLLVGGPIDRPEHQRTLRSTIAWSYQLLPEHQQRLFNRLSVFSGPVSLEMALTVCGGEENSLEDLVKLIDCNLVILSPDDGGNCSLLETMRLFASCGLEESGESDDVHRRLAATCLDESTRIAPDLIGEKQPQAIDRMDALMPNIRSSLSWLEKHNEAELFVKLACSLFRYWRIRGRLSNAEYWLDRAISPRWQSLLRPEDFALALVTSGWIALERGKPDLAQQRAEHALRLVDGEEHARIIGQAWRVLALVDNRHDNRKRAVDRMAKSLDWYRLAGDADGIAGALNNLAILALDEGAWQRVIDLCEESTAAFEALGNIHGASHSLDTMGIAQYELERYDAAMRSTLASLKIDRSVGDSRGLAVTLDHVGKIARAQGDLPAAWEAHAEALTHRKQVGDPRGMLVWLQAMAHWLLEAGRADTAARIVGAIEIARTSMNLPLQHHESKDHRAITEGVQRELGEERFNALVAKGRWVSLEDLVEEASEIAAQRSQEIVAGTPTLPAGIGDRFGLTEREVEVFHLLARRLSDKEIADQLSISARTVNRHVSNVLAKLDVRNRREAVSLGEHIQIG